MALLMATAGAVALGSIRRTTAAVALVVVLEWAGCRGLAEPPEVGGTAGHGEEGQGGGGNPPSICFLIVVVGGSSDRGIYCAGCPPPRGGVLSP